MTIKRQLFGSVSEEPKECAEITKEVTAGTNTQDAAPNDDDKMTRSSLARIRKII